MAGLQAPDPSFAPATIPPAASASLFGHYRLRNQIALGEFCTVHRARSLVAGSTAGDVALKRLRPAHDNAQGRARLLREARVGLGVRSPHLVRAFELHNQPELFMVMEYVEGATLHELLAHAPGSDALRYLVPMFVDVLRGLSALHNWLDEEGAPGFLVHQAPSARHMLLGVDGVTRLIDLSNVHGPRLSAPSENLGRRFMRSVLAPEQLDPSQGLDPRCDIFIVGSVLSDVLAGARGEAALGARAGGRRAALRAIAERARAPRRSDRYWSADEMAYALQKAAVQADLFASPIAVAAWLRNGLALAPSGEPAQARARTCVPPPLPAEARASSSCPRAEARASTPVVRAPPALPAPATEPAWAVQLSSLLSLHARASSTALPASATWRAGSEQSPPASRATLEQWPPALRATLEQALSVPRATLEQASPARRATLEQAPPVQRATLEPPPRMRPSRERSSAERDSLERAIGAVASAQGASPTPSLPRPSTPPPRALPAPAPAALATSSKLRQLAGAAGAIAVLAGLMTIGVPALQRDPTASAARLQLEPALPWSAKGAPEPAPTVTPLALPRTRALAARAHAHAPSEPAEAERAPTEDALIAEDEGNSSIDTIAASIKAAAAEREAHGGTRARMQFARPRMLRSELPTNPY